MFVESLINLSLVAFALFCGVKLIETFLPLSWRWNASMILGLWGVIEIVRMSDYSIIRHALYSSLPFQLSYLFAMLSVIVCLYTLILASSDQIIE